MKAATKPLSRLMRDLFRVEPLEPRVLLSADPITGAAQIVLRPAEDDSAAVLVTQAYAAQADLAVATAPGSTVMVANGAAQAGQSSEWLHVDTQQLAGGNGTLLVGGADSNAVILVGEQDGPALHLGSLVLVNPQDGGEVFLRSDLHLTGSLVIVGSGHTSIVDADVTLADDILMLDSVVVIGDHSLTAGTDGSGQLQLGEDNTHTLNGDGAGGTDSLVLRTPDNVYITGPVGNSDPLEGLTIEGVVVSGSENRPQDVTFTRAVTVNGDLVITASGIVTFNDRVEITGGGDLRIIGAEQIIFRAGVVLTQVDANGAAGDLFLEANEITFQGGDESVSGQGVLTLRPTLVTAGIELGTPPTSQPTGVLNISNDEIRAFNEGFSRIVVGHQAGAHAAATAGTVRIGAINALDQPTLRDPLEVYGGTITVEDYSTSDYAFQVEGSILLDARNNIVLRNRVEASLAGVLTGMSLYSHTGQVLQENATLDQALSEPLRAATLTVRAATGITLGYTEVTTLSATNVTSGAIAITETAAGGDVAVESISQVGSGGISLHTSAGNITVGGSGVSHAGSGATQLQASGTARTITVNESIHSVGGSIRLTAEGAITTSDDATNDGTIATDAAAAVELKSNAGAITQGGLIASAGGAVSLDAFTTLTMNDGVIVRSLNASDDTGSVALRARGGSVTVSAVEADGTISINSAGAIIDGLTGTGPNLDGDTAAVLLTAASAIGAAGGSLQTRVNALSAVTTSGGIFVREATALRIAGGSTDSAINGGSGPVAIVTADGAFTVEKQVLSGGHLLLQSGELLDGTNAALAIQAAVTASGSISLLSADGIGIDNGTTAGPVITAGANQTLDLLAADGIAMDGGAQLSALGGAARLQAVAGNVSVGSVDVASGGLAVVASGSILDAQADDGGTLTINLRAGQLRLQAGGTIGAAGAVLDTAAVTLAASATGAAFLHETDGLTVGEVTPVTVNRIGVQGTVASTVVDGAALAGLDAGGALALQVGADVQVSRNVQAAGHLLVSAGTTMLVAASAGSSGGDVTVKSGQALTMNAGAILFSNAGTMDVEATAGGVSMAQTSIVRTAAANIRIAASGTLTVGVVDARSADDRADGTLDDAASWGDVSLSAGSIQDNAADTAVDVHANDLRLQGTAIGTGAQHLRTQVTGKLTAQATAGAVFLTDVDALAVGDVAAISVQRVGVGGLSAAGPSDAAASGASSTAALVLRTEDGALGVAGTGITAGGNLLLQAQGVTGGVSISAAVLGRGNISVRAVANLQVSANVQADTTGRTLDLYAGGAITQAQDTSITTRDGNMALEAAGGAATLESLSAGTGGVWISAGSIVDGDAAADSEVDIEATSAQLLGRTGIGAAGAALETSVAVLTASAPSGAIFITESNGLSVESLGLNVQRVAADGSAAATANAAQEALTGQTVVLTTTTGNLAVTAGPVSGNGAVASTGNLRLQAVAGAVTLGGANRAAFDISVLGATGITLGTQTALAASGGSVELDSGASIDMASDSFVVTAGLNVRLHAAAGDITVGVVDTRTADDSADATLLDQASWGYVSIVASGSILDNSGETGTDLFAAGARLQAGGAIGAAAQHLELETRLLTAVAGNAGAFLTEATSVEVNLVNVAGVDRVALAGGSAAGAADTGQSGLASTGALVLQALDGAIVLAAAAAGRVSATGNLLLSANGSTSNLDARSTVTSSGGHVSMNAGQDILVAASVAANGSARTIDLVAGRHIAQSQATSIATNSGNVSLAAAGNATLEAVTAGSTGTAIRVSAANIVDGDAAVDGEADLVAASVQLIATGAIGAAGARLTTTTTTLAVDADGDVFLNNTAALVFGNTTVNVSRVSTDGTSGVTTNALLAGLAGDDIVVSAAGSVTTNAGAAIAATGNLLLEAVGTSSNITLNAGTSAAGAISLAAGEDVINNAALATTRNGSTIDVSATGGRIGSGQGSSIVAANANVQLQAFTSVTVESVRAGTGNVRIAGSLLSDRDTPGDGDDVDVVAAGLQITMSGTVGLGSNALDISVDRLTASAGNNSITIVESTGLVLGSVATSVNRVGVNGVAVATASVSQSNVSGGTVVVRTLAGSLESLASGAVIATGNVLLRAAGAGSDLTLGAAVGTTAGNISIEAGRDLLQNANVTIAPSTPITPITTAAAAGKTLDLRAGGKLTQAQGVTTSTVNGHVALTAGGTLTLESVVAGVGRVGLIGTSIIDGDADGDNEVDVQATGVRVQATTGAIGTSLNALETTTSSLALSGALDVFVTESDGVILESVTATVTRVQNSGANAAEAESVTLAGIAGRDVVVQSLADTLETLGSGAVVATRNVLLQAGGAGGDVKLGGAVTSSGGHVTLAASQDLLLNAGVSATLATGTIGLFAGRTATQAQSTAVTTAGGNIALEAVGVATIESLSAGAGAVRIAAATVVDGDTGASEAEVDVLADSLVLQVSAATGAGTNALETSVAALAAAGGGNLFLTETNALSTRSLTVNTQRVAANGAAAATVNGAVAGLATGTTVVRTVGGAMTIEFGAGVNATGDLLLQAGGAGGNLAVEAAVTGAGHVTLNAGGNLQQSAGIAATAAARSLHLQAAGTVTQLQGVTAFSTDGPLSVQAGGNVTLAHLQAGTGTVRIVGASIVDVDADGDSVSDIAAAALQLQTSGAVGTSVNALETTVTTLSADAGGSLFVDDSDALVIGATSVTVQRVGTDGGTITDAVADQTGLVGDGAAVVRATGGSLTTSTTTGVVSVAGNLLLQSSAGTDLRIGAALTSTDGHISMVAGQDLFLDANVQAQGTGDTVDLVAARSIVQAQDTSVTTVDGNIGLEAITGTSTIERLAAGTGGVLLEGGAVLDGDAAGDGEIDITADVLQVLSAGSVGAAGAAVETSVAVLAADVAGSLFVTEADALLIDGAELVLRRVSANGTDAGTADSPVQGLVADGNVVLQTLAGSLANSADATIDVAGNLLLRAGGAGSDLKLDGSVQGQGAITLAAAQDLLQNAQVDAITAGRGLELLAGRHFVQAQDVAASVDGGVLSVVAGTGDATLESLQAGAGTVRVQAVDVIDGDAEGDLESDVDAGALVLVTSGSVGSSANALETTIGRLTADADGDLFVTEADDLVIGTVSFNGHHVETTGSATLLGLSTQSGLAGADVVVRTLAGELASEAANTVAATGNLRLASASGFDLALAGAIVNSGGATTIASGAELALDASVSATSAGASIELLAELGILQAQDTAVTSTNGAIVLRATTDITLESLSAGTAGVRIEGASVLDGDAAEDAEVDIVGGGLQIAATGSIAASGEALETSVTRVTASAAGDIFLTESDDVAVGNVAVSVDSVGDDGAATTIALDGQSVLQGADIVLRALDGALTVLAGGEVTADGNLLLAADGNVSIQADVTAGAALSIAAGGDLVLESSLSATGDGATIDLLAGGAIDAREGSAITTADGDMQFDAGGSVTLESVDAGTGSVRIVASELIDGDEDDADGEVDIVAAGLQLATAGNVGDGQNALETAVATLSVDAGGAVTLDESDGLLLATVSTTVDRVGSDGAAASLGAVTQSDLVGTDIVLVVLEGSLESTTGGTLSAGGNLLVMTLAEEGDIVLGATVTSTGGHVNIVSGRDLLQNADIASTGLGDTLTVVAMGNLTQAQDVSISTADGDAVVVALSTLTLETVDAGGGSVLLVGGEIVDGDADGDAEADVFAAGLLLQTIDGHAGTAANALETEVGTLAADLAGDLFLTEGDGLSLGYAAIEVELVNPDGSSASDGLFELEDVYGDTIVIRTVAGSLDTQASGAVIAFGNVLLQAGGASSDLATAAEVYSESGHVSLLAGQDLLLGADVFADADEASIALSAGRDLTQDEGTMVAIGSGTVALKAVGTVTFESIDAGSGAVSIAAAAIVDGDAAADDTEVDIEAGSLVLQSAGGMGASGNALETSVTALAVSGGGDLFLTESDGLDIDTLSVPVQRVGADGVATAGLPADASGLTTGTTVVRTLDGALTLESGSTVTAGGNLLLSAGGDDADLVLHDDIAGDGDVSLVAAGDLLQDGLVTAVASGSSLLLAAAGAIVQTQAGIASANDGALAVEAGGGFTLAALEAGAGTVRIVADTIVDADTAGDTDVDITAAGLQLVIAGAIGASGNAVETTVTVLAVDADGAVFLAETDTLEIGATSITLRRVDSEGDSNADAAAELAGLQGGAAAVVQSMAGSLAVTRSVNVAGNLLLHAAGASSHLTVGSNVISSGGRISLAAGRDLLLDADVATTGNTFTIDLLAGADIVQAQDTSVSSANGAIALEAAGDVTLESLVAGTAGVRIDAAAITDGDADGDSGADLTAAAALLVASGAIGSAGDELETDVTRLSAHAGGDIFVTEANGLTLDTLTINVQRVGATGLATATSHAAQAGLDGGTIVVRTVAGTLASSATGAVAADGNLLLQAGGAGSGLTLAGTTTAAANISLDAGGSVTLSSSVTATDAGSTIDVLAGGAIAAAQGSVIATENGNVLLQALDGNVTLERVDAGGGSVRISGASLVDGDAAGDSEEDIIGAQLLVTATGNAGSASNAIETSVDVLSIAAGGVVVVTESNGLVLGTATAADIARVGVDGMTDPVAAVTQSGVTGTTITVRLVAGTLDLTEDLTGTGPITLEAPGTIDMAADVEVRTEGDSNIVVTSTTGSVLMDPATGVLRTGSGDIHLTAEVDIRPGALITTGFSYLDARDGRVLIQGDLQRDGEDIDIFANDVTIEEEVSSPGGTLRIGPLELVPMVIGGADPGGVLHLDTGELALLQDGFRQIVFGSNLDGQVVDFRGTAAPLVFRDPLVVNATGDGGRVLISGKLRGDSLNILNSGSNTTLRDATITMARSVLVQDQLVVRGSNAIFGAQDSGSIRFMQAITGYGGTVDKLTLDANGGDIRLDKAVGSINGLTVRDADDVTFGGAVSIAGDLVIEATGTVTFKGRLTLADGGRLIVTGGGKVVFGSSVNLGSGDHLLKVAAIQAKGGIGSIRGTGDLDLRGPSNSTAIHIGSGAPRGALSIGDTFLRAIGKGFDAVQIGNGSAKVTIGATDLRSTASPVVVEGTTIALNGTGSGVRLGTDLTLHASGSITTAGKIVASKASDIAMDSGKGAITMASGSSIRSLGGDVSLEAATGLKVAGIDARGTRGSPGLVSLESTKGFISDANRDKAIDIYASGVTVTGLGPKVGAGDVLEIGAHVVRITPPKGSVLRESGTDARSYFSVLHGHDVYQALVVVGPVTRVTSNVETYLARHTDSELSFSSGQPIKRGSQVNYWSETVDL